MQYKWLNKKQNKKIVIFFNGWGMDETVINHLDCSDYDVIMFFDYNNLNTVFNFSELEQYEKKHLIAWSMGVMIATLFNIKYDLATAINGTLMPIDNKFGIPERIYDLTIKGFDTTASKKFIKNMFSETIELPQINREFENQKTELFALKKYQADFDFYYNKIIISNNDKIIPTKNQEAFWGIESNIKGGHCPFFLYKKWEELL